ncbi:hypothetical protein KO317_03695 [Candidatus Micrarchaeota archaeon]|jgi:RNase P/RNase MRP subunit p30|nr:hypothetical protein [Candidatus Micrarchaeota archaeon]
MYNITLNKIEKKFDYVELFLYNSFSIFKTNNTRIAASNCKKNQIIYLETYDPSMEIIQKAKEKKSIFLINLLDIINEEGSNRSKTINNIKLFLRLCIKYKVEFIMCFLASNESELRTLKEGIALGTLLGLKHKQAKDAFIKIKDLKK